MAEYYSKEDILEKLTTVFKLQASTAKAIIESIPAADVRPVVRGKWRFEIGDGKTCVDGWVCSACNCGFHTNVPYFEGFNFCPNCGADMREADRAHE